MRTPIALLVALAATPAPAALAQDAPAPDRPAGEFWREGSRTLQAYGSGIVGDNDHGTIYAAHAGGGYFFADGWSFNVELLGGHADSRTDDDGVVGGFDLIFRWHFVREAGYTVYLASGAGFQQADTNFPSDSHHNFRLNFLDLGGTWRLNDNTHLMGGARYLHISNAGTSDHNDGLDGAMLYAGLMFPF